MTEEPGRRRLSRRHVVVALLACAALASAVAGKLTACEGCEHEVFGVPLFVAGSVYYLAIAVICLAAMALRLVGWISLPGLGVQAGLVRYLLGAATPCISCVAAAASLFALSVACLWPEGRWRLAPGIVALVGAAILPLWSPLLVEIERPSGLPEFAHADDLRHPPKGVLLIVYLREGCSFCRSFENNYAKRLNGEFGSGMEVRRINAKNRGRLGRLPCFLIRAPNGSLLLIRGLPTYADLADRIRSAAGQHP